MSFTTYSLILIIASSLITAYACGVRGTRLWGLSWLLCIVCGVIAGGTFLMWLMAAIANGTQSGDNPFVTIAFIATTIVVATRANFELKKCKTPSK